MFGYSIFLYSLAFEEPGSVRVKPNNKQPSALRSHAAFRRRSGK